MTIYDIRGTHGSGKSYVPHQLINREPEVHTVFDSDDKQIATYLPSLRLAILGKYDNVCGGCDQISPVAEIERRLGICHSEFDNVMLEGILVAHTFQRWHEAAELYPDYTFWFLDTPLDTCIERVLERRKERGNEKPFNDKNLRKDFVQIANVKRKMQNHGHTVYGLTHRDPVTAIVVHMRGN